jgi:hypothetical protein
MKDEFTKHDHSHMQITGDNAADAAKAYAVSEHEFNAWLQSITFIGEDGRPSSMKLERDRSHDPEDDRGERWQTFRRLKRFKVNTR